MGFTMLGTFKLDGFITLPFGSLVALIGCFTFLIIHSFSIQILLFILLKSHGISVSFSEAMDFMWGTQNFRKLAYKFNWKHIVKGLLVSDCGLLN